MPKVLLVEDDNNLREIFEMRLQAEGYTTSVASDGEEALVVALKEKPDLIIADVMMPKMSGFEMLENLRASPDMKDVKVVMMTALGQAEDRARGEKLGVIKYLVKSQVTLEDFVRSVKEVLDGAPVPVESPQANGQANEPSINKQESEQSMDDQQQSNPNPADEGAAATPAGGGDAGDTNPISGAPADGGDTGQMSTADAQSAVNDQVNDALGGAPAGGDTGGAPTDVPVSEPPTDEGATGDDNANQGGAPGTTPGGM